MMTLNRDEMHQETVRFTVKSQEEGVRLDVFLLSRLGKEFPNRFSRASIVKRIECGQVVHNDIVLSKPRKRLCMNDTVLMNTAVFEESIEPKINTEVALPIVLFEDEHMVFLNKPAGMLTHPVRTGDPSLIDWLKSVYLQICSVGENILRPGIVHRLDRDTSGVLVVAKTQEAYLLLKNLFQERAISKVYHALVEGHLPQSEGNIAFPITRVPHSEKRSIRRATNDPSARKALTNYRVIQQLREADYVEVRPETGRTHQIRIHFSALQHPIIGDRMYRIPRNRPAITVSRQMLHASRLSFVVYGKHYDVEAPLPDDFTKTLQSLTVSL